MPISIVANSTFASFLGEKPVCAVLFWARWQRIIFHVFPRFTDLSNEFSDAAFGALDVDIEENWALVGYLNIKTVPSVVYFKKGKPLAMDTGIVTRNQIASNLKSLIRSLDNE